MKHGNRNLYQSFKCFHNALLDNGIKHGYEVYSGDVLNRLFSFFSENLAGIVPTVSSSSDYYLENTDILVAETDMDGELCIVPLSTNPAIDSIYKYQVARDDALANEENEFQLSEFEFRKYCSLFKSRHATYGFRDYKFVQSN